VGLARERPHGRVRPPPLQRSAQRTESNGDHCPEGWRSTSIRPGLQGIGENSAEASYYCGSTSTNTSGWATHPDVTANLMDGLVASTRTASGLDRVPYPLGFYAKGFDGASRSERRLEGPPCGLRTAIARHG